jgi:hypothetical protein
MRPSATRNGPGEWADTNAPDRRDLVGRIRRMAITLTSKALWQLVGHALPDGRKEPRTADVFSGIGFYARPRSSDRAEAMVLFPGGAGHPVVVGTRNEDVRKAIAGGLAENESAMFNSLAIAVVKAIGTIELRSAAGVAQSTLKGATYRSAEDVMLTALAAAFTALSTDAALLPSTKTACATAATAIGTFQTAAATYLTTVAKVE